MSRTLAVLASVALLGAACGEAPEEEPAASAEPSDASEPAESTEPSETTSASEPTSSETAASGDLTGCMVTDVGGIDDRSFNQTAYNGLEQAEEDLGAEVEFLQSNSDADFQPNIQQFVGGDCSLIVTVGFLLDGATQTAAQENPDQNFAIVDVDFAEFDENGEFVGDLEYDNVRELTFATDQAAFLAGYLAASETQTGTVGTYGGINIPSVSIFMDGFLAGVDYHNQENGTDVEVLGWDGSDGLFTGNFDSTEDGRNLTDQLLQQGADIIMPVAGPVGDGTVTAVSDSVAAGQDAQVIWVDTDGTLQYPGQEDLFLTSVEKRMNVAVFDTMESVANDAFEGGLYTGTLENEGVGISMGSIEGEMATTLDELRQGIIAGDITTTPEG